MGNTATRACAHDKLYIMAADKLIILFCIFSCLRFVRSQLNLTEGSPCVTRGLNGTCVGIFRCDTAALTYIYTNAGFEVKTGDFREFPDICSYNNKEPVVCCTDCDIQQETHRHTAVGPYGGLLKKEEGTIAKEKCYEYFRTLPYTCRFFVGYHIIHKNWIVEQKCYEYVLDLQPYAVPTVGGQNALRWEFPHMALIGYGDNVASADWLCGGSVISERFILTAAHCTSTYALVNISFAALGILKRTDPMENWKIYEIKRIVVHPEYKAPSKYHDIALLETKTKITFSKELLPACLHDGLTWLGDTHASGWGRLGHRQALADTLQVVYLDEFSAKECSEMYKPHRHLKNGYDHEKQMCFGDHRKIVDTCEGDSGGPLQVKQNECQYIISGVTSYGRDCGIRGSAGMYTRVSYYVPWIESVVWPEETQEKG